MKRILALILVIALCLGLCACGGGKTTVDLTKENIEEYLDFSVSHSSARIQQTNIMGVNLSFSEVDVFLKIYPTVPGGFENVSISMKIHCPNNWEVDSSDREYDPNDTSTMTFTVDLPANGEYNETHTIGRSYYAAAPSEICSIEIVDVSGSFISSK